MAEPLGCGNHRYTITDINGQVVDAGSGTLTQVEYNRVLNDTSSASVTIGTQDLACCRTMSGIRSWHHKLNIYRDDEFMWSGFILTIDWTTDSTRIQAVDLSGLLDRRVPHQNLVFENSDLTLIAEQLIDDGFAPDDPGHDVVILGPAMVLGGRAYAENVGQVGDHLRDLADTGIDFTVLGETFLVLPDDFCEVVGRLTDEDLPEGMTVTEDGSNLVTRQIVAGSDESDVFGIAGGRNAYYGLLELYEEQTSITTTAAAQAAATARLAASAVVPVGIDTQNVTLASTSAVPMASLVPGWCVDITTSATCRNITQRLKITGLQVTEDGGSEGSPGQERIVLQVTATGNQIETV